MAICNMKKEQYAKVLVPGVSGTIAVRQPDRMSSIPPITKLPLLQVYQILQMHGLYSCSCMSTYDQHMEQF